MNTFCVVCPNELKSVVVGASATDLHAIYPANTIMAGVAVVLAALLLLVAIRPATGASTGFLLTAAAVLSILPILVIFIVMQRWGVQAVVMSGLEG